MIASPLRPRHDRNRASLLKASSPNRGTPYGASLSFATTTHLGPPSDPPSRKPPQRNQPHWGPPGQFQAAPLPSMLDSPYRAPGQDFHLRSQRPCQAHLRSFYELAAIIAGQPRRDPQPESLKLRGVLLQLGPGPALRGPASRSRRHGDLFRSGLHSSSDNPGVRAGRAIEPRNGVVWGADAVMVRGRSHRWRRFGESSGSPAGSENLSMCVSSSC